MSNSWTNRNQSRSWACCPFQNIYSFKNLNLVSCPEHCLYLEPRPSSWLNCSRSVLTSDSWTSITFSGGSTKTSTSPTSRARSLAVSTSQQHAMATLSQKNTKKSGIFFAWHKDMTVILRQSVRFSTVGFVGLGQNKRLSPSKTTLELKLGPHLL